MNDWPEYHKPRNPPDKVYIRFGRWSARSYNHCTGEKEAGVSVYPAKLVADSVVALSDDWEYPILLQGRCIFPVTGVQTDVGSDGEPVLRKVKALPYAIAIGSVPYFMFKEN